MLTRILEKLTALDRLDRVVQRAVAAQPARPVFATLRDAFGLHTRIDAGDLARIPRTGPVICVSNHPAGFSDGLVVPAVIDAARDDMKAMAHHWFERWPALARRMFLVDPQRTDRRNATAMKEAVRWVRKGHALYIAPAGEVAHGRRGSFEAEERPWRAGLAALVRLTGATVVPIHAQVSNRRRFHVLSWLHPRLGALVLCREFFAQRGRQVRVRVGNPLSAEELRAAGPPEAVTAACRDAVLDLGEQAATPRAPRPDHAQTTQTGVGTGVENANAV